MADPIYTTGDPVWNSLEDNTRVPLTSELESGWPCGEVDPELLNFVSGHGWNLIHNMLTLSGLTPSIPNLHQLAQAVQAGKINYAVAGGTANVLTATLSPAPTAYTDGLVLRVKTSAINTGPATLNVNGLGAISIVSNAGGAALTGGELQGVVELAYDGGVFRLVSAQSVGFRNLQAFTSSGTFVVPAGVTRVKVTVKGGGGGGAHCAASGGNGLSGGGGGEGGTSIKIVDVTPGASITVTVGAGGLGNTGTNTGINGGTSSFGAFCSATGGNGASFQTANSSSGASGGSGIGGDINITGAPGIDGQSKTFVFAGQGGGAAGGKAGRQGGGAGAGYGNGGGGANDSDLTGTAFSGGAGSSGIVIVEW